MQQSYTTRRFLFESFDRMYYLQLHTEKADEIEPYYILQP